MKFELISIEEIENAEEQMETDSEVLKKAEWLFLKREEFLKKKMIFTEIIDYAIPLKQKNLSGFGWQKHC